MLWTSFVDSRVADDFAEGGEFMSVRKWLQKPGLRLGSAVAAMLAASLLMAADEPGKNKEAKETTKPATKKREDFTTGSSDVLLAFINEQTRQGWSDNNVEPSDIATDTEWIRRVYLDVAGHVPPMEDVETFLADKDKAKRSKVIDKLLDDPAYIRHWTTVWTNLCIGQDTPQRVSRKGMQKFFREAFAKNRPWNEVVADIVSAFSPTAPV